MHKPISRPIAFAIVAAVIISIAVISAGDGGSNSVASKAEVATVAPTSTPPPEPMVTEASYEKLRGEYNDLVKQYNELLVIAQPSAARRSISNPVHCTSNTSFGTTTTNCY